ncbi:hypothetical protein ES702_02314 [subsurface metagenome]
MQYKNKHTIQFSRTFLIVGIIILCSFVVFAFEFDNVGQYDEASKTITIKNSFLGIDWFSYGLVATAKLETSSIVWVEAGEDKLVAIFTINNSEEDYSNFFKQLDFYNAVNMKERNAPSGLTLRKFVQTGTETIQDYSFECEEKTGANLSKYTECLPVEAGTHEEILAEWQPVNVNNDLGLGEITIGIFVDVEKGDYVEWIPTLFGVEIDEWAIYGSAVLDDWNDDNAGNFVDNLPGTTKFYGVVATPKVNLTITSVSKFANCTAPIVYIVDSSTIGNNTIARANFTGSTATFPEGLVNITNNTEFGVVIGNESGVGYNEPHNVWRNASILFNNSDITIGTNLNFTETLISWAGNGTGLGVGGAYEQIWCFWNITTKEIYDDFISSTLDSPANNTQRISMDNFGFSATQSSGGGMQLKNTTLKLWNLATGLIFKTNFSVVTGSSNSTNLSIYLAPTETGIYKWNYLTCGEAGAITTCTEDTNNRTFTFSSVIFDNQNYTNTTIEGALDGFRINFTTNGLGLSSANLIYNGSSYLGTTTSYAGNKYTTIRQIGIPEVSQNTNISFYWNVIFSDSSEENSTAIFQQVLNMSIDDCSSLGTQILNLTLMDEEYNSALAMTPDINSSLGIDATLRSLSNASLFWNINANWTNTTNVAMCIPNEIINTSQFNLDIVGKYSASNYVEEFYHLDNYLITNNSIIKYIYLRDLKTADSTSFLTRYKESGIEISNAIISVLRKYVGEGLFREVEAGKTNNDGQTILHLVEEDVIYMFNISLNGEVRFLSSEYRVYCTSGSTCSIELEPNVSLSTFPEDWDKLTIGTYNISSEQSTRIVRLDFNIVEVATMNLSVYKYSNNQSEMDHLIAQNTSTISGDGFVSIFVPRTYGNATFYVEIFKDTDWVGSHTLSLRERGQDYFGTLGAFLGGLIVLALALMSASTGVFVILFALVGFAFVIILQMVDVGTGYNILYGPLAVYMYLVSSGAILFWKVVQRRSRDV